MSGFHETPAGERVRIGFFGRRNVGKSSLLNAVTGQPFAVVSDAPGTTTDPVSKAMELLPLGPVVMIDTPGLDDEGALGELRMQKALDTLSRVDIAVVVLDALCGRTRADDEILARIDQARIPRLIAWNKCDVRRPAALPDGEMAVSARTGENVRALKERLARMLPDRPSSPLARDLVPAGAFAVLVVPIDAAAPKGRLILPQQQVIRDLMDGGAMPVVTRDAEYARTLQKLGAPPALVVTDSQAFERVARETPEHVPLTSFSILFARYKGELDALLNGVRALDRLQHQDRVLISEGCTHHRQCGDIGTHKLPTWIAAHTGARVEFDFSSGADFPRNLAPYRLVLHCGGCMLSGREMKGRIARAEDALVPVTNYGMAIAHMKGVLERALSPLRRGATTP